MLLNLRFNLFKAFDYNYSRQLKLLYYSVGAW